MSNTNGLKTVEELLDEYMAISQTPDIQRRRAYQGIVSGYTDLNMYHIKSGKKIQKITMNANLIATLPSDYVNFVKVGVPYRGKLWTFTREKGIIPTTTESAGSVTLDEDWGEGVDINEIPGDSYGKAGGYNVEGYYELDENNWRIIFRNVDRTNVILEYNSSGVDAISDTFIPLKARNAIFAYADWYLTAHIKSVGHNVKEANWQAYMKQAQLVKLLDMPSLTELADAWDQERMQALKM